MKRVTWINLILGIWLIISPLVFGSVEPRNTAANDIVLGVLLIASSWWILAAMRQIVGMTWFQMFCGVWLVIAPFVLMYRDVTRALANDVVVGVIVFIVGLIASQALERRPVKTA